MTTRHLRVAPLRPPLPEDEAELQTTLTARHRARQHLRKRQTSRHLDDYPTINDILHQQHASDTP